MEELRKGRLRGQGFIERVLQPRALFYLVGILVVFLYHLKFDLSYGDVVNSYGNVLKRGSEYFPQDGNVLEAIYNFTVFHYTGWSSRNVIEIVLIIVGALPAIYWHILDIGMVMLIGYCLENLVPIKDQKIKYMVMFSFLMMYYVVGMRSAGWIAVTINYSWVVAAALYMFLIVQKIRGSKGISKASYALALLAAFYAMNQEQMCGMSLLVLGIFLARDVYNRKLKKSILPFFLLNIAEFMWILTCPGNACRKNVEISSYFPSYGTYSFMYKIYEGVCSLLKALFDIWGMVIITVAFLLLLLYLALREKAPTAVKLTLAFPLCYIIVKLICTKGMAILEKPLPAIFMDYRLSAPAAIAGCLALACMFAACWYVTRGMGGQLEFLGILCSAAATKVVLGFSLAFQVSGERTSIFLAFTLIFASLFLIGKNEPLFQFLGEKKFLLGLGAMDVMLFLWNYYLIVSEKVV